MDPHPIPQSYTYVGSVCAERRNHARELVYSEELSRWDALAVMSGDGLMHEVRLAAPRWGAVAPGCCMG